MKKRHCCTIYAKLFFIVLDFMFLLTIVPSSFFRKKSDEEPRAATAIQVRL